jgi:serine/threonine protein kinase
MLKMFLSQNEKFGKYILLDRIAVGGMAEVYRAKLTGEKGFEKLIVVKKMLPHMTEDPEMVRYFIDEAKLAALLQHENIIHIYDFGETKGSYFIAMEYLFGKDLKSVYHKSSQVNFPINLENSLFIASKICEGLEYAHNLMDLHGASLNIVHRDISPQNIFVTYDGKIKTIDFGIAKTTTQTTKTRVGIIKGKVAYMSPEQAEGKSIDRRSDIFAVGILLYEMITRKEMYEGDTMQVLNKAINAQYEPPENIAPGLPPKVYEILHRALNKNLEKRYQSCGEMMTDIENCLYDINCRPNAKMLAKYITSLFEKEYSDEKIKSIEILEYTPEEEHTNARATMPDQNYQKTKVMSKEFDDKDINKKIDISHIIKWIISGGKKWILKLFSSLSNENSYHKKDILDFLRKIFSGRKKWITLTSALIILMAAGLILMKSKEIKHIKQLMLKAEISTSSYKLTYPEEDCAYYYYNEVLKLDSGNHEAKQGIEEIPTRVASLAKRRMKKLRYINAKNLIEQGLAIDPNHPELLSIQKELNEKLPIRLLNSLKGNN